MKILTIQSDNVDITQRVYADLSKCNHATVLPVYQRLFSDYNGKYHTDYSAFFWGFTNLLTDDLKSAAIRAFEMIGERPMSDKVFILEVPDAICLETDFYNYSDEIYAYEFPNELDSCWESIYEDRNAERQVIFPYIDPDMILESYRIGYFF